MTKKDKKSGKDKKGANKDNIVPLGPLRDPLNADAAPGDASEEKQGIMPGEMERLHRIMEEEIEKSGLESLDDVNAFIAEHFSGRTLDDIFDDHDMSPEDEALALVEQADRKEKPEEKIPLLLQAIDLDPLCLEARIELLHLATESDLEFLLALKSLILNHERAWGKDYMEENRGHFWGLLETRSYMRARFMLLEGFDVNGFPELAAHEAEEMLELNPGDNLGVRDQLRGLYLALGYPDELRQLNERYSEGGTVTADWSNALCLFLEGKEEEAEAAVRQAHESNPYAISYLSGRKKLPDEMPPFYSLGSDEEAIIGADIFERVCDSFPKIQSWLRGLKGLQTPRKKKGKKK